MRWTSPAKDNNRDERWTLRIVLAKLVRAKKKQLAALSNLISAILLLSVFLFQFNKLKTSSGNNPAQFSLEIELIRFLFACNFISIEIFEQKDR